MEHIKLGVNRQIVILHTSGVRLE